MQDMFASSRSVSCVQYTNTLSFNPLEFFSAPCVQDTGASSCNPLDFCKGGRLHGSVHERHLLLIAVAGVVRRMGVSQHRFTLPLELLLQHCQPVIALAEKHLNAWKQWQITLSAAAAAARHSMQMDVDPTEVESIPTCLPQPARRIYVHLLQMIMRHALICPMFLPMI